MSATKTVNLGDQEKYGNALTCEVIECNYNRVKTTITDKNHVKLNIVFMLHDKSRKNSHYQQFNVGDVYVDGLCNTSGVKAEHLTDATLNIERHKQWICEGIVRGMRHIEFKIEAGEEPSIGAAQDYAGGVVD